MEQKLKFFVIEPQKRGITQREKLSLLSKVISKKCLRGNINTKKSLFKCIFDEAESELSMLQET